MYGVAAQLIINLHIETLKYSIFTTLSIRFLTLY